MKIKFFKKDNSFKKKDFGFNVNLYWKFTLGGATLLILLSFLFGYNLFLQTDQDPTLSTGDQGGQVPTVNPTRMEKVLNYFTDREKKSTQIINSPAPVSDPS